MELLLMMDALKRASAERITAVLPYYGYARQDRKDRPRMPISARLVASLLERAGANRILALDLHAAQIQGFFDVPVDHLFATPVMIDYFDEMRGDATTVVSPDAGGVERARAFEIPSAAHHAALSGRFDAVAHEDPVGAAGLGFDLRVRAHPADVAPRVGEVGEHRLRIGCDVHADLKHIGGDH
jgi:ribose-phosphate pyrophosphokinase